MHPTSPFADIIYDGWSQSKMFPHSKFRKILQQNTIEIKDNKARHNLSNVKYRQMALQSVDGAVVGSFLEPLSQTKVMHSHQRKIT